jgi:hypothetical protein
MGAQVGFSQPSDVSSGGKGMGGGSYVGPQGPQMGFGMDPATGLPFGQAGQTLNDGLNSAFGGLPGYNDLNNAVRQGINTAVGPTLGPALGSGFGGGKNMANQRYDTGPIFGPLPTNSDQLNPNIQKGFGMPAGGYGNDMGQNLGDILGNVVGFGGQMLNQINPGLAPVGNAMGQVGNIASNVLNGAMAQPQPTNRFAPPNAPGVRQQPRTAPRAGVPVQSARTVQPNRFTNTRTRPR